jgi:hypothetical protein
MSHGFFTDHRVILMKQFSRFSCELSSVASYMLEISLKCKPRLEGEVELTIIWFDILHSSDSKMKTFWLHCLNLLPLAWIISSLPNESRSGGSKKIVETSARLTKNRLTMDVAREKTNKSDNNLIKHSSVQIHVCFPRRWRSSKRCLYSDLTMKWHYNLKIETNLNQWNEAFCNWLNDIWRPSLCDRGDFWGFVCFEARK